MNNSISKMAVYKMFYDYLNIEYDDNDLSQKRLLQVVTCSNHPILNMKNRCKNGNITYLFNVYDALCNFMLEYNESLDIEIINQHIEPIIDHILKYTFKNLNKM